MPEFNICADCAVGLTNDDWTHLDYEHDSQEAADEAYASIEAWIELVGEIRDTGKKSSDGYANCACCGDVVIGVEIWTNDPPLPHLRDSTGKLPSYVWPGGYPVFYLADDTVLCPDCANDANDVTGHDCHWEGPPMYCDSCGAEIESAYGDPDEDEDDE